jgi:hypothetical protein
MMVQQSVYTNLELPIRTALDQYFTVREQNVENSKTTGMSVHHPDDVLAIEIPS